MHCFSWVLGPASKHLLASPAHSPLSNPHEASFQRKHMVFHLINRRIRKSLCVYCCCIVNSGPVDPHACFGHIWLGCHPASVLPMGGTPVCPLFTEDGLAHLKRVLKGPWLLPCSESCFLYPLSFLGIVVTAQAAPVKTTKSTCETGILCAL